ncbi:MAG: helix-turn-helix domain-containing protein [Patescibacteria group bacterium]
MSRFNTKSLGVVLSFGEVLRTSRQEHGFSLKQIGWRLKIPERYLQALEEESFHSLPAGSYGRYFLREYAQFLKLPVEPLLKEYDERAHYFERAQPTRPIREPRFKQLPVKWLALGILAVALVSYLAIEARRLFLPPPFELINPPTNIVVDSLSITLNGVTKAGTTVLLNGERVAVGEDGYFTQDVTLQPGLNTITISARRAYSKPVTMTREILVQNLPKTDNL